MFSLKIGFESWMYTWHSANQTETCLRNRGTGLSLAALQTWTRENVKFWAFKTNDVEKWTTVNLVTMRFLVWGNCVYLNETWHFNEHLVYYIKVFHVATDCLFNGHRYNIDYLSASRGNLKSGWGSHFPVLHPNTAQRFCIITVILFLY